MRASTTSLETYNFSDFIFGERERGFTGHGPRATGTVNTNASFEEDLMRRLSSAVIVSLVVILTIGASNLAAASGTRSASNYSLSPGPNFQTYADVGHKYVSESFSLVNGNSRKLLVRGIGQSGPGLQLLIPTGSGVAEKLIPPSGPGMTKTVPPHKSIRLTVWLHVIDCAKVPKGSWPLTMDVAWTSGKWQRVSLQMPSGRLAPWPRSLTDLVCQ